MRLNDKKKREKDEIRKQLAADYGDGCLICGTMDGELYREIYNKELDIHHIDENKSNWNYSNLCLAHFWCNIKETTHGKIDFKKKFEEQCKALEAQRMKGVLDRYVCIDEAGLRVSTLAEWKNQNLKKLADQEFIKIIDKEGEVEREGLLDAMAKISNLTQQACRNYLKAFINPHNGEYEQFDKEEKKYIRRKA